MSLRGCYRAGITPWGADISGRAWYLSVWKFCPEPVVRALRRRQSFTASCRQLSAREKLMLLLLWTLIMTPFASADQGPFMWGVGPTISTAALPAQMPFNFPDEAER